MTGGVGRGSGRGFALGGLARSAGLGGGRGAAGSTGGTGGDGGDEGASLSVNGVRMSEAPSPIPGIGNEIGGSLSSAAMCMSIDSASATRNLRDTAPSCLVWNWSGRSVIDRSCNAATGFAALRVKRGGSGYSWNITRPGLLVR